MSLTDSFAADKDALRLFVTEIKLRVNQNLYRKGVISEGMYIRAKELILKNG